MSHLPLRKEKNCLNCGTEIIGRYCHVCGQENIEPKEKVWHLVLHFFSDLTHFDGKFFSTSKYLLIKPGFLSAEYVIGRRTSYLNPIRMYLFMSALFFIFFFSIYKPDIHEGKYSGGVINITDYGKNKADSEAVKNKVDSIALPTSKLNITTRFNTIQEYDSAQAKLPAGKRDGWISREFKIKEIHLRMKYGNNSRLIIDTLGEKFLHSFPQMLFVSLPFFALLLTLLYARNKKHNYVDNFIFSVHLYCAMFAFLFVQISFSHLEYYHYLGWLGYVNVGIILYIFYYLYRAMRYFYKSKRGQTILKYILLLLLSLILMLLLFAVFFLLSLFTI